MTKVMCYVGLNGSAQNEGCIKNIQFIVDSLHSFSFHTQGYRLTIFTLGPTLANSKFSMNGIGILLQCFWGPSPKFWGCGLLGPC